jgi:hypothetical protein
VLSRAIPPLLALAVVLLACGERQPVGSPTLADAPAAAPQLSVPESQPIPVVSADENGDNQLTTDAQRGAVAPTTDVSTAVDSFEIEDVTIEDFATVTPAPRGDSVADDLVVFFRADGALCLGGGLAGDPNLIPPRVMTCKPGPNPSLDLVFSISQSASSETPRPTTQTMRVFTAADISMIEVVVDAEALCTADATRFDAYPEIAGFSCQLPVVQSERSAALHFRRADGSTVRLRDGISIPALHSATD